MIIRSEFYLYIVKHAFGVSETLKFSTLEAAEEVYAFLSEDFSKEGDVLSIKRLYDIDKINAEKDAGKDADIPF